MIIWWEVIRLSLHYVVRSDSEGCAPGNQLYDTVSWNQLCSPYESVQQVEWAGTAQVTVGLQRTAGRPLSVSHQASCCDFLWFPDNSGAWCPHFVSFPANAPEYGIESILAERDKWNLEMQNHRVYSAPVQAQWHHFQRLSDMELF